MSSMTILWESPIPRTKRPFAAAWAERACCAIAVGWRGGVGVTPVASSIRSVSRPAMARVVIASKPKMFGRD